MAVEMTPQEAKQAYSVLTTRLSPESFALIENDLASMRTHLDHIQEILELNRVNTLTDSWSKTR